MREIRKNILMGLFLILGFPSYSQNTKCKTVIYKTAEDLRDSRGIEGEGIAINTHITKYGTEDAIKLKKDGSWLKFYEGSVYAYKDEDSLLHRYYKDYGYVTVLFQNEKMCLYSRRTHGKYHDTYYYFNKNLYSPLIKLTKSNITKEYSSYPIFIQKVQDIRNESQLVKRNNTGQIEIVSLLMEYTK